VARCSFKVLPMENPGRALSSQEVKVMGFFGGIFSEVSLSGNQEVVGWGCWVVDDRHVTTIVRQVLRGKQRMSAWRVQWDNDKGRCPTHIKR
jgi:hypothetical protein